MSRPSKPAKQAARFAASAAFGALAVAAYAAGLTEVILPERNRPDLDDIPSEVRDQMRFHIVGSVDQVLELALQPAELAMAA